MEGVMIALLIILTGVAIFAVLYQLIDTIRVEIKHENYMEQLSKNLEFTKEINNLKYEIEKLKQNVK